MTKKHFIALADHIRTCNHADGQTQAKFDERVIDDLANFCAEQNSRFDRSRWIAYIKGECGPNGGKL